MSRPAHLDHIRRFSYATPDQSVIRRAVIRTVEFVGGQRRLRRSYLDGREAMGRGENFFAMAVRALGIDVVYEPDALARIPKEGPVLFVANHPYGVLDGVTLTWLALKARPDVKVMAHGALCALPEAEPNLLAVDFAETPVGRSTTLATRAAAQAWLRDGHAIGIFPAGGISTSRTALKGPALDLPWAPFTAKLAMSARATVVPIYFEGQNSRLFQIASHLSLTLRLSLLFRETVRRMGTPLRVRIGAPIPYDAWRHFDRREDLVAEFRRRTFDLADDAALLSGPGRLKVVKPSRRAVTTAQTIY